MNWHGRCLNFRGALDAFLDSKGKDFLMFSFDYRLTSVTKKEPNKTRIAKVKVYMPCPSADLKEVLSFIDMCRKYGVIDHDVCLPLHYVKIE